MKKEKNKKMLRNKNQVEWKGEHNSVIVLFASVRNECECMFSNVKFFFPSFVRGASIRIKHRKYVCFEECETGTL